MEVRSSVRKVSGDSILSRRALVPCWKCPYRRPCLAPNLCVCGRAAGKVILARQPPSRSPSGLAGLGLCCACSRGREKLQPGSRTLRLEVAAAPWLPLREPFGSVGEVHREGGVRARGGAPSRSERAGRSNFERRSRLSPQEIGKTGSHRPPHRPEPARGIYCMAPVPLLTNER
jgi:hypothetical protein